MVMAKLNVFGVFRVIEIEMSDGSEEGKGDEIFALPEARDLLRRDIGTKAAEGLNKVPFRVPYFAGLVTACS